MTDDRPTTDQQSPPSGRSDSGGREERERRSSVAGVREEAKPSLRPVWVVFARRKYSDPLAEVGTVRAETPELAAMFARSIYDEHPWIEMIVVPRASIRTVIVP